MPHETAVYGARPHYAADMVAGFGFTAGRAEPPVRRHVTDLGDGTIFIEGASAPSGDGFTVVSPPPKPGLLARLFRRGRR